jgi:hypothetical protein
MKLNKRKEIIKRNEKNEIKQTKRNYKTKLGK